jgi:hypothetical protein
MLVGLDTLFLFYNAPGLNLTCDVEGTMAAHMDHFEDAAISVD